MKVGSTSGPGQALSPLTQIGLLAGPFLTMVDSNVVNVALPGITRDFSSSLATSHWVVSGYLLALAAVLGMSAYLAKRFGTRRVYLASLLGFTAASALCAFAPTIGFLIAARALQGALGAPLVPLAMGMLMGEGGSARQISPAAGILLFFAPTMGPTVGGVLIDAAGWPLIFLINVPLGLLGFVAVARAVGISSTGGEGTGVRLDLIGLLMLSGGLALATYGISQGPLRGWLAEGVWPIWTTGGCLMCLYVVWALRHPHPAVDLKLLRHPQSALAVGLCVLAAVVLFSFVFLVPVFMQTLQGLPALGAGLVLLPQGLLTGLGTVLGTKLAGRLEIRSIVVSGMAILTAGTAALLTVDLGTPPWLIALILSVRGLALGLTVQPLLSALIGSLAPAEVPDGNTLFNVAQRLGGSAGIALLATFWQVRERFHVEQALGGLGATTSGQPQAATGYLDALPAGIRDQVAQAAVNGFHDAILVLTLICFVGVCAAALLRVGDHPTTEAAGDSGGRRSQLSTSPSGSVAAREHGQA